ncbi:hypothetical protein [Azospirillum largimobile]
MGRRRAGAAGGLVRVADASSRPPVRPGLHGWSRALFRT